MASTTPPPPATIESTVVIPMALQAFVGGEFLRDTDILLAPLAQPDVSKLQTRSGQIPYDLVDEIDTSETNIRAAVSPRFIHPLGKHKRLEKNGSVAEGSNRDGIYLSWCLPRLYRSAITSTDGTSESSSHATGVAGFNKDAFDETRVRLGYPLSKNEPSPSGYTASSDGSAGIHLRPVPDRWLVFCVVDLDKEDEKVHTWVIESNRLRTIRDSSFSIQGPETPIDMGIEASLTIDLTKNLDEQEPIYLGMKQDLSVYPDNAAKKDYRIPFTSLQPGNSFFTDYQPGNMHVFSLFHGMLPQRGEHRVSYVVIGFHSDPAEDPLAVTDLKALADDSKPLLNKELLEGLSLSLDSDPKNKFLDTLASSAGRVLCHGVLHDVRYDERQPIPAPSVEYQQLIQKSQPIALGGHTLDALAAYLYTEMSSKNDKGEHKADRAIHQIVGQLVALIAGDEDIDQQRKAIEQVATPGWLTSHEGTVWKLPQKEAESTSKGLRSLVDSGIYDSLVELNAHQALFDTYFKEYSNILQQLYDGWWNATSLRGSPSTAFPSERSYIKRWAMICAKDIDDLKSRMDTTFEFITSTKTKLEFKLKKPLVAGSPVPYGIHQDPTVLFAGITSGWPKGFAETLPIRIASQIAPSAEGDPKTNYWFDMSKVEKNFPDVVSPILPLVREFQSQAFGNKPMTWPSSVYQDIGLERWNGKNAWFPLFVEWEVEYFHVAWDCWEFVPDIASGTWKYAIRDDVPVEENKENCDYRAFGGRTAIAPQLSQTLKSRLKQLFDQSGKLDLDEDLKEKILEEVSALQYFSTPLDGFTDHLVTRRRGNLPRPRSSDESICDILGVEPRIIKLLETRDFLAPYGSTTIIRESIKKPFKPVTHGQVRFTKLAIVDKFGQIVFGVKPAYSQGRGQHEASRLYPCVAPSFSCGLQPADGNSSHYFPHTIFKADDSPGVCQFFQIPPRINQKARLNASFLKQGTNIPVNEWDNPIWGWLLPNYADHSIHVFNPDGTFVTEVLLMRDSRGKHTALAHRLGSVPRADPVNRLVDVVSAMADFVFTEALFHMMSDAADEILGTSADSESMLPAAFGRPFCLADIGLSIELAERQFMSTSELRVGLGSNEPLTYDYEFPVALGNSTAAFDGLVGTFKTSGPITTISTGYGLEKNATARLRRTSSEHGSPLAPGPKPIKLTPYHIPQRYGDKWPLAKELSAIHSDKLHCLSCILDPLLPLHVYSGSMFPVAEVSLPQWATATAMATLQAYFTGGPMLVPDMPALDTTQIQMIGNDAKPKIQLPLNGISNVQNSSIVWMAPSLVETEGSKQTTWKQIAIRNVDESLKVEEADNLELVEGFVVVQKTRD